MTSQDEKWRMFRGPWGGRAFWVYVNDDWEQPFDYVDVFGRTGKYYHALELTYFVTAVSGQLKLSFKKVPGQNVARICSIAVRPDGQNRASKGVRYGHNWPGFDYWKPSDPDVPLHLLFLLP